MWITFYKRAPPLMSPSHAPLLFLIGKWKLHMATSFGWVFSQIEGHQRWLLLFSYVVGASFGPLGLIDCWKRDIEKRIFGPYKRNKGSSWLLAAFNNAPSFFLCSSCGGACKQKRSLYCFCTRGSEDRPNYCLTRLCIQQAHCLVSNYWALLKSQASRTGIARAGIVLN